MPIPPWLNLDPYPTLFPTHAGLFEYRVLPFGLTNAPAAFQREMKRIFGEVPYALVYLDDILVFSKNEAEHVGHLRNVLQMLRSANYMPRCPNVPFSETLCIILGISCRGEECMWTLARLQQ